MGVHAGRRLVAKLAAVAVLAAIVGIASRGDRPAEPTAEPPRPGVLTAENDKLKQTEADAVKSAKALRHAVEIGAYRGERRDVWAEPDGSFTEYTHQKAVRTVRDKHWVTPDATLERNPDGGITPKAATFGLRLSGGGSGPFLTADRAGKTMSLTWPGGPLPAPTIDGDTATYAEVEPGVDLVVHAGTESFSHVLVVKDAEAARRASIVNLALGLETKGLTVREAGGGLEAVTEAGGGRVFEAAEPKMWDSGDGGTEAGASARVTGTSPSALVEDGVEPSRAAPLTARKAPLGVRFSGGMLHLTPNAAMLADPATRYPVYIDPIWSASGPSFWAMVDSGYPNEEYAKFDDKDDERAGYCRPDPECNNSAIKRLLYKMPTNYRGKTILSAQFQVSLVRGWNNTARNIQIWQMSGDPNSSTNWNNMPTWSTRLETKSVGAEQSCRSTTRNTGFNVTAAIKDAVTDNRLTTTFGIKAENESNKEYWKRFCSNGLLRVNWNRAPSKPATSDLSSSPGGACVSGTSRPYVDTPPRLSAVLRDPDHLTGGVSEPVQGQFRVRWTPPGGTQQQILYTTGKKASGSRFDYTVPGTIPQNVVVMWDVRTSDGTVWGAWSSDNGPPPCEFMYDATTPSAPKVQSAEYLEDRLIDCATYSNATWRNGVGVQSTFTFDSDSADVVEYRYGINTNPSPSNVLHPTTDGGPVTLVFLPQEEGVVFITVEARDRANKSSAIANCSFRVGAGAKAIAEWQMADEFGSEEATDAAAEGRAIGGAPATVHGVGLEFGVAGPGGASDRAVSLPGPGGGAGYLQTTETELVNTERSFGVSAWVKLDELGRSQTVVSQDGAGQAGFTLGYDAGRSAWEFGLPTTDVESLGRWTVVGGTVQLGKWTHLLGVFDQQSGTIAILVDGVRTESQRRSRLAARGVVQIGRHLELGTYTNYLNGDVADVSLFNRVVVPNESGPISEVKATRNGYWPVNAAPSGVSPEQTNGQPLTLGGGATIGVRDVLADPPSIPMVGTGELRLDGVDDYAATAAAPVQTDHSFSVVARVRVASTDPGQPLQTVLSQPGTNTSAFVVRRTAENRWGLMMTMSDMVNAVEVTAHDSEAEMSNDNFGQQVALTYNAFTNEVKLYVDGQPTVTGKVVNGAAWNAPGGLQVGRAFLDGIWAEYFEGAVDEIRAYSGALDLTTVQLLNQPIPQDNL